ncbi:hypothetical protein [Amycolatopsis pigmentata]|uniref:Uncharacterized protein n=1 Tax=Amycolatopsis pigmentata TaxID=450801 RepID=A0ABW5FS75_9PSEU
MNTEWKPRAPSAHCYECGSMDVVAVCHHCGRPMCREHGVSAEVAQRSTEFTGLNLDNVTAWHCTEHDHTVDGGLRWLMISGAAAAVLGIIFLVGTAYWVGGSLAGAGGAGATLGYVISHRRRSRATHARPPFPLVPTIESISLTESVHADIRFDEVAGYQVKKLPATGRLTVDMLLRQADRDRLDRYREKYRLAAEEPVPVSIGFVMLRGPVGLEFDNRHATVPVFALPSRVSDLPFLASGGARDRRYQIDLTHHLRPGLEIDSIPLWLTPALVAESDRRTLELDVGWDKDFGYEDRALEIDRVNEIRLIAPVGWGAVRAIELDEGVQASRRSFGRKPDPDDPDEVVHLIRMSDLRLPKAVKERCRLRVVVHFEGRVETADSIRGSIDLRFRHALSGVSEVQVYHALGGPRRPPRGGTTATGRKSGIATTLTADFSLSLAKVRYQDALMVPDPREPTSDSKLMELEGVIPDHRTVAALTDALSDNNCYVKRVVENPGSNGPSVDEVRRYWDISGRYYERLFPIEFRITLTGNEFRADGDPVRGNTTVAVAVRGVYTDDPRVTEEPGMQQIIKNTWKNLCAQTRRALEESKASRQLG